MLTWQNFCQEILIFTVTLCHTIMNNEGLLNDQKMLPKQNIKSLNKCILITATFDFHVSKALSNRRKLIDLKKYNVTPFLE
jgi:hypothetical protein